MKRINLLPQEERVKASRERGLIWAILILVALVVVLGLVYVKYNSDVGAKEDELAGIQAETGCRRRPGSPNSVPTPYFRRSARR